MAPWVQSHQLHENCEYPPFPNNLSNISHKLGNHFNYLENLTIFEHTYKKIFSLDHICSR